VDPRTATLSLPPPGRGTRAVACLGLVATDFLVRTRFPVPRDTKVRSNRIVRQGGGPAANAAVGLARLGLHAGFVGAVGDDALGREQLAELADAGVDVGEAAVIPGATSFASLILIDEETGERTILSAPDDRPVLPADAPFDPSRWDLVLTDGWLGPAQRAFVGEAREQGVPVLLDAGSFRPETDELLELANVVIASEPFARELAGGPEAALDRLLARGALMAAITRGARGALAGARGSREHFAVPSVPARVLDTTGAGDAFHAGAAFGLVTGLPWGGSLALGAAVASLVCEQVGPRAGLPALAAARLHGRLDSSGADS